MKRSDVEKIEREKRRKREGKVKIKRSRKRLGRYLIYSTMQALHI